MVSFRSAAMALVFAAALFPVTKKPVVHAPARTVASSLDRQIAQRWLRSMSLHDIVAQLIVIPCYGDSPNSRTKAYQQFVHQVRDVHVGGMIIINRALNGAIRPAEPHAMAAFFNRMQRFAKIPLIMGSDFERGASMRVTSTTKYPHNMAYGAAGDLAATRYEGAATAREARALGVQWVFAPVADVNNNPDNPIINIRSYGEDPAAVAAQVKAYIEGAQSDPKNKVLVTAKHFPGHGDTATDSHMGLASITADRARMNAVELVPFRAAIEAKVDSIMTAHMSVPAIEPEIIPATVSAKVLTGLLRNEMGFDGIIVTDAMDMQGLARQFAPGEASVRALEAGADVLLMPLHPEEAIRAVLVAIERGRLSRKRVEESALKLLAAKVRLGLNKTKLVDLESIPDAIDSPEADDEAQRVTDKAVTLLKNEGSIVPLRNQEGACMLILSENRYGQQGRRILDELKTRAPKLKATLLDPLMLQDDLDQAARMAIACGEVVVAAFASVSDYRGSVGLPPNYTALMNKLLDANTPVTLISLGSPYLLRTFPKVRAYMTTFTPVVTAEGSAVKALMGEIPITGKMPVSIPDLAKIGDGIQLGKR